MSKDKKLTQALLYVAVLSLVVFGYQNCGAGFAPASLTNISSTLSVSDPGDKGPAQIYPDTQLLNQWKQVSPSVGVPSARYAAMVWTGSRALVYGSDTFNYLNDGFSYDPVTNSWSPLAPNSILSGRENPYVAWTGTSLLVYGGYVRNTDGSVTALSDGALYDSTTNVWSAISSGGPPYGYNQVGCWAGTKMIIVGGQAVNGGSPLNALMSYDPVTNKWRAVSELGAPSPRSGDVAICSGTKMFIFGGNDGKQILNDSYLYDARTDHWLVTSSMNAPSPRVTAMGGTVGGKFVIYSGYGPQVVGQTPVGGIYELTGGGLYDPDKDQWTTISTSGALSGRIGSAVVSTGDKLIFFGGGNYNPNGYVPKADGAIFDPLANKWEVVSPVGIPSPRFAPAVWTGASMLLFGGETSYFGKGAMNDLFMFK